MARCSSGANRRKQVPRLRGWLRCRTGLRILFRARRARMSLRGLAASLGIRRCHVVPLRFPDSRIVRAESSRKLQGIRFADKRAMRNTLHRPWKSRSSRSLARFSWPARQRIAECPMLGTAPVVAGTFGRLNSAGTETRKASRLSGRLQRPSIAASVSPIGSRITALAEAS